MPLYPAERLVRDFHEKMGLTVGETVGLRDHDLRVALINEEAGEFEEAVANDNMVEAIDALCDLLYVIFGAAVTFGIPLSRFFTEVHRSNMLKEPGVLRDDGKLLKPEGWEPPRIKALLDTVGEGSGTWEVGTLVLQSDAEPAADGLYHVRLCRYGVPGAQAINVFDTLEEAEAFARSVTTFIYGEATAISTDDMQKCEEPEDVA